jgi:hypothetical protein
MKSLARKCFNGTTASRADKRVLKLGSIFHYFRGLKLSKYIIVEGVHGGPNIALAVGIGIGLPTL